jgi:hypothetical protein
VYTLREQRELQMKKKPQQTVVTVDDEQFVNLRHQPLLLKSAAEANEFLNKVGQPEASKKKSNRKTSAR